MVGIPAPDVQAVGRLEVANQRFLATVRMLASARTSSLPTRVAQKTRRDAGATSSGADNR